MQAFSGSYDSAPRPPPPPSPSIKLDRRPTGRLRKRDMLLTGGGAGNRVGVELNHSTARKPSKQFMPISFQIQLLEYFPQKQKEQRQKQL